MMMMMNKLNIFLLLLLNQNNFIVSTSSAYKSEINLGCRDDQGKIVDWFYVYKLPVDNTQLGYDGLNYYYMTSSENEKIWRKSNTKIDDNKSMVGRTVKQIYNDNDELAVAIYNDEQLIDSNNLKSQLESGHTKGVFGANSETGFWLIHSVPKFPPPRNESHYKYPQTARRYGQSLLCITADIENLNTIGKQLIYNEPKFFTLDLPESLEDALPNLKKLIDGTKITSTPYWNLETVSSIEGTKFKVFAKTGKFGKELYADWVAPTLDTDLLVETWVNGPGKISSDCSKRRGVYNIAEVEIGDEEFTIHHDHSKWAVSNNSSVNWICVGDINREVLVTIVFNST